MCLARRPRAIMEVARFGRTLLVRPVGVREDELEAVACTLDWGHPVEGVVATKEHQRPGGDLDRPYVFAITVEDPAHRLEILRVFTA